MKDRRANRATGWLKTELVVRFEGVNDLKIVDVVRLHDAEYLKLVPGEQLGDNEPSFSVGPARHSRSAEKRLTRARLQSGCNPPFSASGLGTHN
jgi:hypothetical protein